MSAATFERLSAEGREAILAGAHQIETPPVDGGHRWGLSAIFRPDDRAAAVLGGLTQSVRTFAGADHWSTAAPGSAHMTIRGLEPHRVPIPVDDPAVGRYASALERATRKQRAFRFDLGGLLVTPISVMLRATPCSDAPAGVWLAFDRELADDGWFESNYRRDIWYFNLIHFAGPIARPAELIEWVEARSGDDVGEIVVDRANLVRWEFDGRRMVPFVLAEAPLTA